MHYPVRNPGIGKEIIRQASYKYILHKIESTSIKNLKFNLQDHFENNLSKRKSDPIL